MRKYWSEEERRKAKRANDRASAARRRLKRAGIGGGTSTSVSAVNVALVLDASGSMNSLRDTAIQQINRQVQNLSRVTRETGQRTYVSLYLFNNRGNLRPSRSGSTPTSSRR